MGVSGGAAAALPSLLDQKSELNAAASCVCVQVWPRFADGVAVGVVSFLIRLMTKVGK
jgi:hypothetical protein